MSFTRFRCFLVAVAAALVAPIAAHAGTYTTSAALIAHAKPDYFVEPFNGPDNQNLPNLAGGGNGYNFLVTTNNGSTIYRVNGAGAGATFSAEVTRLNFTNTPVSVFGGTFRAFTVSNGQPAADTITILTSTGETFSVPVPVAGAFFGFSTAQPFTWVTFAGNPNGSTLEFVDDVYVGTSTSAAVTSDFCSDAPTVSGSSVLLPYTTVGATVENIAGSCASPTLDNGPDVWVRYVASASGSVTMGTCGCSYDSTLRVFDNCAYSTQVACNDDDCLASTGLNRASRVSFRVVAGADYYVRIGGFNANSGTGTLSITLAADCPADFNHDGANSVQDIFDFLASWFAGCP